MANGPNSFLAKIGDAEDSTEINVKKRAKLPGELVKPAGAPSKPLKPGVERWTIKTGTDAGVSKVGKDGVVDTTVDEMVKIPRPKDFMPVTSEVKKYETLRVAPSETTVWRLEADVIAIKLEADGDFHLVLQSDSGEQMIGEIPDPDPKFVKPSSPFFADIQEARNAADVNLIQKHAPKATEPVNRMLVPPGAVMAHRLKGVGHAKPHAPAHKPGRMPFKTKIPPTKVRVTGVGFFDKVHGQLGVSSSNGIELHPVLRIEFL